MVAGRQEGMEGEEWQWFGDGRKNGGGGGTRRGSLRQRYERSLWSPNRPRSRCRHSEEKVLTYAVLPHFLASLVYVHEIITQLE